MATHEEKTKLPIFTERFRTLRGERTQAEFAIFLEISRPTVGFYENGERIPDASVLARICKKCEVSADWLIGLTEVRQVNAELRSACEYTGLSEKAILKLPKKGPLNHVMNLLAESEQFPGYLQSLAKYVLYSTEQIPLPLPWATKAMRTHVNAIEKSGAVVVAPSIYADVARARAEKQLDIALAKITSEITPESRAALNDPAISEATADILDTITNELEAINNIDEQLLKDNKVHVEIVFRDAPEGAPFKIRSVERYLPQKTEGEA